VNARRGYWACPALSADGKRLYSGRYDKMSKVWNLEAEK
jgi:hypothetical protein